MFECQCVALLGSLTDEDKFTCLASFAFYSCFPVSLTRIDLRALLPFKPQIIPFATLFGSRIVRSTTNIQHDFTNSSAFEGDSPRTQHA